LDESARMRERYLQEATGHLSGFFRGWEFVKEAEGVRIYKKVHVRTKAICFKGIGYVDKPHDEVADYILNFDNRTDWDPLYMYGETIEKLDSACEVRYECYETPSSMHFNRDFCVLWNFYRDRENGDHTGICRSVKNVGIKPQSNFVRADAYDTGFYIRADPRRPKEASQVTFITQIDPKGNYPGWLRDLVNEEQASFITTIRKAMTRILISNCMKTILLEKDMIFTVKATFNEQALALWVFNHHNLNEVFSMTRTRRTNKKIIPEPGDFLYSNLGNKLMQVLDDSSAEQHEYLNNAMNFRPYTESDADEVYRPCCEHLHQELMEFGLSPPDIPLPWPLWSIPSVDGIKYYVKPSDAVKGDRLRMKALTNVVVVVASTFDMQDEELRHESHIEMSSSLKFWPSSSENYSVKGSKGST